MHEPIFIRTVYLLYSTAQHAALWCGKEGVTPSFFPFFPLPSLVLPTANQLFNAKFHKFGIFENDLALKVFKFIYCLAFFHKNSCFSVWH